jgi:hypothetical protein
MNESTRSVNTSRHNKGEPDINKQLIASINDETPVVLKKPMRYHQNSKNKKTP